MRILTEAMNPSVQTDLWCRSNRPSILCSVQILLLRAIDFHAYGGPPLHPSRHALHAKANHFTQEPLSETKNNRSIILWHIFIGLIHLPLLHAVHDIVIITPISLNECQIAGIPSSLWFGMLCGAQRPPEPMACARPDTPGRHGWSPWR